MSDVLGVSGRAVLNALVAGERDPAVLARLARGCLVPRITELAEALRGAFTDHHAFLLGQLLTQLDQLIGLAAACDAHLVTAMGPHEDRLELRRPAELGCDVTPLLAATV